MLLAVPHVVHCHVDWSAPVNWSWRHHRNLQTWFFAQPNGAMGWGTTRWRDLVGKNPATLTNFASPPSATSGWATSRGRPWAAGSLRFDGSNDTATCSSYPTTVTSWGFTGWFNLPSGPTGTHYLSHFAGATTGWRVFDATASSIKLTLPGVATYDFTSLVPAAGWNFVAISSTNGSTATMWLNTPSAGLVSQTLSIGSAIGTPTTLQMGPNASGAQAFIGWIDDLRVFKSTITDAQVRAIHDDAIRGYPDALARHPVEQWFADTPPAGGGGGGYWSWWAWQQFGNPQSPE